MKESQLQSKVRDELVKHGWMVIKLIQTNMNGIPDLLCIRKGVCMFFEIKTEDGVVAPLQEHRIKQLKAYGVHARVIKCMEDLDVYIGKNC